MTTRLTAWLFERHEPKHPVTNLTVFLRRFAIASILVLLVWQSCDRWWHRNEETAIRRQSPDRTKTAVLIRHRGFDLNFIVKVETEAGKKTLYVSGDYDPDPQIDWREELQWSSDSKLLVFSLSDIYRKGQKQYWAYDFMAGKSLFDEDTIKQKLQAGGKDSQ